MTDARDKAAKVMSSYLWNRYEYLLPEAPGHVTQLLLQQLEASGLEITYKGETNGKDA